MRTVTVMTEATSKKGFVARNIWVLAVAVLMVLVAVGAGVQTASHSAELTSQQQRITELDEELHRAQGLRAEAEEANRLEALGVSETRVVEDKAIIERLLTTALTWEDAEAYDLARDELIEGFDLDEKGSLLRDFMPPAAFTEREGERVYFIDEVGTMFDFTGDFTADVVRVRATEYEYIVIADVEVTSSKVIPAEDGSEPSVTHQALLRVTLDDQGEVTAITGQMSDGQTRASG